MKKRALVSVSDKTNLVELCQFLVKNDYEIISTGGTGKYLQDNNIDVINVSDVTGFPEILDGRVKTLHPKIHGGILSLRNNESHIKQNIYNSIEYIDMVIVNFYPFGETISKTSCTFDEAIENIDIGGPSMLRSAAKNYLDVTVLCDFNDYKLLYKDKEEFGDVSKTTRMYLSAKAFSYSAKYDSIIANYLLNFQNETFSENLTIGFTLENEMRYGENPHQKAALYKSTYCDNSIIYGKQLHGKQLSYNNILDGNAALEILSEFEEPTAIAVKHTNPCGVGSANDINEAFEKAYNGDPVSIFGGIIALNREVDVNLAKQLSTIFLEIIIAPSFSKEALEILTAKKNIRLMEVAISNKNSASKSITSINGGMIVQEKDYSKLDNYKFVTQKDSTNHYDIAFGWKICKHVKSNAIVVVSNGMCLGVGAGQMSRIASVKIALESAKEKGYKDNLVLVSDAFFPFDDAIEFAKDYGVNVIVQPGGSVNDKKVIDTCNKYGIAMVFTDIRNFKH